MVANGRAMLASGPRGPLAEPLPQHRHRGADLTSDSDHPRDLSPRGPDAGVRRDDPIGRAYSGMVSVPRPISVACSPDVLMSHPLASSPAEVAALSRGYDLYLPGAVFFVPGAMLFVSGFSSGLSSGISESRSGARYLTDSFASTHFRPAEAAGLGPELFNPASHSGPVDLR